MDKNFIAYLEFKNLSKTTQKAYCRNIDLFLKWYKVECINATKKDILKYLEYLKAKKNQSNISRRNSLISINHYYTYLLQNEAISSNPTALIKIRGTHKRQLYKIYTTEELDQLHDNYYHSFIRNFDSLCYATKLGGIQTNQIEPTFLARQRNYIILGLLIYQGLNTSEFTQIELADIDTIKATIKIKGGLKSNPRTLTLKASQIGAMINYIENIRPQFLKYCTENDRLFFALPESSKQKTTNKTLIHIFKPLTKQVKSIDKNLLNFKQVRASVITHWLKIEGLRKTQYLAGHRYISSTERYLPNEIDGLIENIAKYHPDL